MTQTNLTGLRCMTHGETLCVGGNRFVTTATELACRNTIHMLVGHYGCCGLATLETSEPEGTAAANEANAFELGCVGPGHR